MLLSMLLSQMPGTGSLRALPATAMLQSPKPVVSYFAFRLLVASAVGKSSGIGSVTLPLAAHSVPRNSVVIKPTHSMLYSACPIGV
jgi:hypothetical protein